MRTAATRRKPAPLPATAPPPRPRPIVDGRAEVPWDLVLDGRLSATTRLVLASLARWGDRREIVSSMTDAEIGQLNGISERTVRQSLKAGELAGWIARMAPAELAAW